MALHKFYRTKLLAAAAVAALGFGAPGQLLAETPADTFIQAWTIDDMISLDPAEVFEFSASEILGNTYEPIIGYDITDVSNIFGVVAESWVMSADGKTMSFTVRQGKKFASGNDIMADDVVYSLVRAVKLDKSPAFILGQFGLTPDNVETMVRQTGDYSFDFTMDQPYAPTFLLYCLTATVAMVVDKDLVAANEVDGDWGYNWLKTNYAGSGAFTIREWRANESVVLERNDNYSGERSAMARAIYRHVPEAATQRLLLEKGDIDVARDLLPEEIAALSTNPDVQIQSGVKGTIFYMALNQKNAFLSKPEVREAMKYLVDYQAIADTIVKGKMDVHQTFLPKGFLGELDSNPYSLNVEKAKELLAAAGLPDGFTVTMDTRNTPDVTAIALAVQQTMALAGITLEIIPGDGGQTLEKYRARTHDIYIGNWGPDYQDPHTNVTFARNPDNSDDAAAKPLAWRNSWEIPEMTARADAAVLEPDGEKRAATYRELQAEHQKTSPFIIMFQETEVAVTFLGLLLVTFLISHVISVDPVLAVVGDRASKATYDKMFLEMGLDKPLWQQFWIYLEKVLSGNFGNSFLTKKPVLQDIGRAFPATLELATVAILIGTVIGIPLGVLSAVKAGKLVDQVVRVLGLVGYSAPIFWLGILGLLVFYAKLGWIAGPGRIDISYEYSITPATGMLLLDAAMQGQWAAFRNAFSHIILPASLLGYYSMAYISRMTRSFMLSELAQEYIVTARVKGVPEWRIVWVHALRNAAVPLVTVVALSYAGLLEGSVLTETVFAWPGLGLYLTNSLQVADMNAVLGGTLLIGAIFIGLNLLSDLLYTLLDPRVRRRGGQK